jgi:ssDNA-binding Zn-finger/Zn-ribbon topoisomerase 1|tara:strand:+ start:154 stop:408 length:255 start_codon:yes stop_codon:yes gene_type:complete
MDKLGKDIFGRGFDLKAEVTNGECPLCNAKTVFVSIYHNLYRCMSCGGDTEQKVNGVITYMPIATSGCGPIPEIQLLDPDEPKA